MKSRGKKNRRKKTKFDSSEIVFFCFFFHLFAFFFSLDIVFVSKNTARGFGMRVVGGKTGADGRLFAYLVWTVPGGPAEKGGLQQGDKVNHISIK